MQSSSPPITSTLSLRLRRLLVSGGPKVALGRRVPFVVKKEEKKEETKPKVSSSLTPPPDEVQVPKILTSSCCLCTARPGVDQLSVFCSKDCPGLRHLRSLLEIGYDDDDDLMIFCFVCRQTVTTLVELRREVEEIEATIRTVMTLRNAERPHPPDQGSTSKTVNDAEEGEPKVFIIKDEEQDEDVKPAVKKVVAQENSFQLHGPKAFYIKPEGDGSDDDDDDEDHFEVKPPFFTIIKNDDDDEPQPQTKVKTEEQTKLEKVKKKDSPTPKMKRVRFQRNVGRNFCPTCNKTYRNDLIFKTHTHSNEKYLKKKVSFNCSLCTKTFGTGRHFMQHMDQVHLKTKGGRCGKCKRSFKTARHLQNHTRICSVPEEEQRKCSTCRKVFASLAERVDHERVVHQGLLSTRCYFCRTFWTVGNLTRHLQVHTLERPFFCSECRQDFPTTKALRGHTAPSCALAKIKNGIKGGRRRRM